MNPPAAKDASNSGTKDKAETESRSYQAHPLGSILLSRDIGNVCLRRRDIAARNSIEDTAHKQHQEGFGKFYWIYVT